MRGLAAGRLRGVFQIHAPRTIALGRIIRAAMDDERLERILHGLAKIITSQDAQILDLIASVTVLKLAVAELRGEAPELALAAFRDREQKALKEAPISQQLQEVRDLLELLQKHGKQFGKNQA